MAETSIEWTGTRLPDGTIIPGFTFNPWWGCVRVSPGCENCYAEAFDHRLGRADWGAKAPRRFFDDAHWRQPLKWNARAAKLGVRLKVFCASMADVFEDRADLVEPRARLYRLVRETPHLDWLLLTKRPENADRLWILAHDAVVTDRDDWETWGSNVWLGTTVEDQRRAAERIPHLLRTRAVVRFLSCEPLLERVDLRPHFLPKPCAHALASAHTGETFMCSCPRRPDVDWVIVGGESGHGARPFDLQWARSLIVQCKAAGVACFMKQIGDAPVGLDGNQYHRRDKGGDASKWAEEFRVREWPAVQW